VQQDVSQVGKSSAFRRTDLCWNRVFFTLHNTSFVFLRTVALAVPILFKEFC